MKTLRVVRATLIVRVTLSKAIGRSNTGYVVAVVLLSFLRQIYIIYSIAKLSKSMRMPLQKPL